MVRLGTTVAGCLAQSAANAANAAASSVAKVGNLHACPRVVGSMEGVLWDCTIPMNHVQVH